MECLNLPKNGSMLYLSYRLLCQSSQEERHCIITICSKSWNMTDFGNFGKKSFVPIIFHFLLLFNSRQISIWGTSDKNFIWTTYSSLLNIADIQLLYTIWSTGCLKQDEGILEKSVSILKGGFLLIFTDSYLNMNSIIFKEKGTPHHPT